MIDPNKVAGFAEEKANPAMPAPKRRAVWAHMDIFL